MGIEFTICKVRWERYPRVSGNTHARDWLEFQAARGLAANTLDAYGRNLDAFLQFVESRNIALGSVARNTVGAYIRDITQLSVPRFSKKRQETRTTLANASLQQHLTVVRLFYDYLVEENVCLRNPLRPSVSGCGVIRRHERLPWIPTEDQWRTILEACQQETLRNRTMLAMSYESPRTSPGLRPVIAASAKMVRHGSEASARIERTCSAVKNRPGLPGFEHGVVWRRCRCRDRWPKSWQTTSPHGVPTKSGCYSRIAGAIPTAKTRWCRKGFGRFWTLCRFHAVGCTLSGTDTEVCYIRAVHR